MRKKIDIVELSMEYCKNYNIPSYDNSMILNEIKNLIENYFEKQIYMGKDAIKFIDNDRKISISEALIKYIKNGLSEFISRYIKSNTHLKHNYELQYTVQKCTVYKKTEHGYYVSFLDKYAYISKVDTITLELGEKYYLFIEKYNKSKALYKAIINNHKVAQVILCKMFGEETQFKANAYKINTLLSLIYMNEKPSKEEIKKMRIYFKTEKIIYNKKDS